MVTFKSEKCLKNHQITTLCTGSAFHASADSSELILHRVFFFALKHGKWRGKLPLQYLTIAEWD